MRTAAAALLVFAPLLSAFVTGCTAPSASDDDDTSGTSTDAVSVANAETGKQALEDALLGGTLTFERALPLAIDPYGARDAFVGRARASLATEVTFAGKRWDVMACEYTYPVGAEGTTAVRIEKGDAFAIKTVSNVRVSGEQAWLEFDVALAETAWFGEGKAVELSAKKCQLFVKTSASVFDARVK